MGSQDRIPLFFSFNPHPSRMMSATGFFILGFPYFMMIYEFYGECSPYAHTTRGGLRRGMRRYLNLGYPTIMAP